MTTTIERSELKAIVKEALVEIITERRELIHDVLEDSMEEIGLARAIEEGKNSGTVSRDAVFAVFEAAA